MAVLVEAISVIVKISAIQEKMQGGWPAFLGLVPNKTLCADNEIARVGFMSPKDVEAFIDKLQAAGLEFLKNGESIDIAVADQTSGFTARCMWAEFGRINYEDKEDQLVSACRLFESELQNFVTPREWQYEGSISQTVGMTPNGLDPANMEFLRHENGMDVYRNPATGKEVFVARSSESQQA
ncbi:hypothetical protein [Solimonas marina]|uniref:Uncharacterized protein n=1 Tax=Solimonas marina TaxID=2714601 RepID=A0A969WCB6_9GAMM|nr:hypothetical protein [Solimonas marina]NKF24761.1 hypothetical protein [Solimonas marina]